MIELLTFGEGCNKLEEWMIYSRDKKKKKKNQGQGERQSELVFCK